MYQLSLFKEEDVSIFDSKKVCTKPEKIKNGDIGDYVIMMQKADSKLSGTREMEKAGEIKIYAVRRNRLSEDVRNEVYHLNYDLPGGSDYYFTWCEIRRLGYFMPKTYAERFEGYNE